MTPLPLAQFGEASDANQITRHSIFKRPAIVFSGPCNSYKREIENEEYHTVRYFDTEGIPTIGVGHNLNKSSSQQQVENVGADYDEVLNGRQALTESQIKTLFYVDRLYQLWVWVHAWVHTILICTSPGFVHVWVHTKL